ncbi:hypothetical protein NMY22_g17470 [Coprinellus aureogranulatus]|nr:hypothetical protein NMY22_g17470 [Coprinellus aureogranulatus]
MSLLPFNAHSSAFQSASDDTYADPLHIASCSYVVLTLEWKTPIGAMKPPQSLFAPVLRPSAFLFIVPFIPFTFASHSILLGNLRVAGYNMSAAGWDWVGELNDDALLNGKVQEDMKPIPPPPPPRSVPPSPVVPSQSFQGSMPVQATTSRSSVERPLARKPSVARSRPSSQAPHATPAPDRASRSIPPSPVIPSQGRPVQAPRQSVERVSRGSSSQAVATSRSFSQASAPDRAPKSNPPSPAIPAQKHPAHASTSRQSVERIPRESPSVVKYRRGSFSQAPSVAGTPASERAPKSIPASPVLPAQSKPTHAPRQSVERSSLRKSPVVKSRSSSSTPHVTNGPEQASTSKQGQMGPPTSGPSISRPFTIYSSSSEIVYDPESATKQVKKMSTVMLDAVGKVTIEQARWNDWKKNFDLLLSQEVMPSTLIAVCGATGAGKSSVLNAVLEANIAPTSGMRACTAVVTKFSYHKRRKITAKVLFLTRDEWRQELEILLKDLTTEEGSIVENDSELAKLSTPAKVAWEKIHAVYPMIQKPWQLKGVTAQQIIDLDPGEPFTSLLFGQLALITSITAIEKKLDTSENIDCKSSDEFMGAISKYIDSVDHFDADGPRAAFWPLIREVHIRCKAHALSTGAVLVDLPGVADANAARNNIAQGYMRSAKIIWIVAPITRAVDDGTAQSEFWVLTAVSDMKSLWSLLYEELLGDVFKLQLLADGKYSDKYITFIASKCDDVSCKEIITALRLRREAELIFIESRITDIEGRKKELEKVLSAKRAEVSALEAQVTAAETGQRFVSRASPISPKKRKRSCKQAGQRKRHRAGDDSSSESDSDSDSSDSDSTASAPESEPELPPETPVDLYLQGEAMDVDGDDSTESKNIQTRTIQQRFKDARDEMQRLLGEKATLDEQLMDAQRQKNAFCSKARSVYARKALKEQFRSGLEEVKGETAKAMNVQSMNLPVFTCSSRDYVRITKQVQGDGEPVCFTNVDDTGIPALQDWCHELTRPFREEAALQYIWILTSLASSIRTYLENIEDNPGTAETRRDIRIKYESNGHSSQPAGDSGIASRLTREFTDIIDKLMADLRETFKSGIAASCDIGVLNACNCALEIVKSFFKPWQTWKAVLRRKGDYRERNLNDMLLMPFMKEVANSFADNIDSEMPEFQRAKRDLQQAVFQFLEEFRQAAAKTVGPAKASNQLVACQKNSARLIDQMVSMANRSVESGRATTSRSPASCVKLQLERAYNVALEDTGTGSISRQQLRQSV